MPFSPLLPDATGLSWNHVLVTQEAIRIHLKMAFPAASCPRCGKTYNRVHTLPIKEWRQPESTIASNGSEPVQESGFVLTRLTCTRSASARFLNMSMPAE